MNNMKKFINPFAFYGFNEFALSAIIPVIFSASAQLLTVFIIVNFITMMLPQLMMLVTIMALVLSIIILFSGKMHIDGLRSYHDCKEFSYKGYFMLITIPFIVIVVVLSYVIPTVFF